MMIRCEINIKLQSDAQFNSFAQRILRCAVSFDCCKLRELYDLEADWTLCNLDLSKGMRIASNTLNIPQKKTFSHDLR